MAVLSRLDGKRVLVIGGGGGGIGRAIVRSCADAGATVAVADLDAARAAEAVDELRAAGRVAHALSGDVRSGEQLDGMIVGAAERLGGWTPWSRWSAGRSRSYPRSGCTRWPTRTGRRFTT